MVDGHNSHCTLEFLEYARSQNIHILCYPAHATHIYQALDVGVFSVLKKAWTQEHDEWERTRFEKVSKENFLTILGLAWVRALTPENIKSSFRKTGVWPYDPSKITPEMMAPSRETAYRGSLPLPPPTPVRILTDVMQQLSPFKRSCDGGSQGSDAPLRALAQETRAQLAETSAAFLVTSSPIKSTSRLPAFVLTPTEPVPSHQRLDLPPHTETEQTYLDEIRSLREALARAQATTRAQNATIFLQSQYCESVREQLATSEKPKKPTGRIIADGMPRLLTDEAFIQVVEEHNKEQERQEAEKQKRKQARDSHAERLKEWREQEALRKVANTAVRAAWAAEVEKWEIERDLAKRERRKPGWTKPLLKGRLERPIPKPRKVVDEEDDEEWADVDDDASEEDESLDQ